MVSQWKLRMESEKLTLIGRQAPTLAQIIDHPQHPLLVAEEFLAEARNLEDFLEPDSVESLAGTNEPDIVAAIGRDLLDDLQNLLPSPDLASVLPGAPQRLLAELAGEVLVRRNPHVDPVGAGVRGTFQRRQPVGPADQALESNGAVVLELDDLLVALLREDDTVSDVWKRLERVWIRHDTYGETAVWAAQMVEILDFAADDDFVDAEQLAAAQLDLEIAESLNVEQLGVVHGCDGRWSRRVCILLL